MTMATGSVVSLGVEGFSQVSPKWAALAPRFNFKIKFITLVINIGELYRKTTVEYYVMEMFIDFFEGQMVTIAQTFITV